MTIRLLVFQQPGRPLAGLCGLLRRTGHDVTECQTADSCLDLLDGREIDTLVLDAGAIPCLTWLDDIKTQAKYRHLPVMMVAARDAPMIAAAEPMSSVDDIIELPLERRDLLARIQDLARLASMTTELRRRRAVQADFGVDAGLDMPTVGRNDRLSVLLIGPPDDERIRLMATFDGTMTAIHAESCAAARHHLSTTQVDMVIITSAMAIRDVQRFCRAVRSRSELADMPILLIAGPTRSQAFDMAAELEVSGILSHPLRPVITRRRILTANRLRQFRLQLRGLLSKTLHNPVVDGLTELYGHGFLHHYVDRCIADSRSNHHPLAIAGFAITGLKDINRTWGYPVGDRLLRHAARALVGGCRAQDLAARHGGAHFCLILNQATNHEARALCARITTVAEAAIWRSVDGRTCPVGLRATIAELGPNDDAETLLRRAFQRSSDYKLQRVS